MKKMFLLLLVALLGSQMIFSQDVIIGTVRTDGFQKITKGAFWSKRPESKMIYDGSYPPGFKVYTLESDYFVRFVDEEHNQNDKNYIVFPKGEKVYTNQNGQYFAAICGNKIEFLRPVDMVSIIEKENFSPVAVRLSSPVPTPTSNPVSAQSAKRDTVYIVEREIQQDVSEQSERPERSEGNTYYINNTTPYGYYGMGYYYGYYGGNYCYRYYGGLAHHYNYYGNYYHNGYTGNYNHYTGSNYNYTGGYNHSTGNYNHTGGYNRSTNYGAGYTGRRGGNTTTTTNRGTMTPGRGYQNTGGTGGGRSNISPSYNSRNQTPTSVGRSSTNSFSSRASSTFRSSANTGGGQRGRR